MDLYLLCRLQVGKQELEVTIQQPSQAVEEAQQVQWAPESELAGMQASMRATDLAALMNSFLRF